MSGRNPYFTPKLENEYNFSGYRPEKRIFKTPTHIAHHEEPWSRLHHTATSASLRRSVTHNKHEAPKDNLDFQLDSVYDHHRDIFFSKSQALLQKETVAEDNRKRELEELALQHKKPEADIIIWVDPDRRSIFSINKS